MTPLGASFYYKPKIREVSPEDQALSGSAARRDFRGNLKVPQRQQA